MPGQAGRLMADALHQVAVRRQHPGAMIDQAAAEARGHQPLRQSHPDGGAEPLSQRPGGGLDSRIFAQFRMSGGGGVELAEMLQLLDPHAGIAGQVQQRIQQHRAMPGRQHETIPIRPRRVGGIEFEEAREQHGSYVGHAQRHAGMTGLRLLDRVNRQEANGFGHFHVRKIRTAGNTG